MVKFLQISLPLDGEQLFFGVVAFFATGYHVSFGTFATAGYRHDMIHGQLFWQIGPSAVVTDSFSQAAFPPLGIPQFSGSAALPFEILLSKIIGKRFYGLYTFQSGFNLADTVARHPANHVISACQFRVGHGADPD